VRVKLGKLIGLANNRVEEQRAHMGRGGGSDAECAANVSRKEAGAERGREKWKRRRARCQAGLTY
jgi:hypothetical protein